MKAQNPNARFWVFIHDGWVKLTLRPGQVREHCHGGRDEEGWSRTATRWEWEDGVLTEQVSWDATDCDGRVSHDYTHHASDLAAVPIEQDLTGYEAAKIDRLYLCIGGVTVRAEAAGRLMFQPQWRKGRCQQRDYAAEAAGY